ncbi:putative ATPase [Naumannella cuiyingiana]|uniref:Putative ATPase n=1 Tax=Naumannella cuiyingiana TaxID=1347891 RepID=A0A7Z0D8B6_9ACTN|nr:AAA family ATPase [Naumannella cuiyingiana]NYI70648.1 putative ATPase [Naumannella cuiyingiana]
MTQDGQYQPLLRGIGFSGYRSIAVWQEFFFPTKVTVLAGTNNSGKSNVLRFLQNSLSSMQEARDGPGSTPGNITLSELDRPQGFRSEPKFEVGIPLRLGSLGERCLPSNDWWQNPQKLADYMGAAMSLLSEDGVTYWSRFIHDGSRFSVGSDRVDEAINKWPRWSSVYKSALSALGGGTVNERKVMQRILESIGGFSALPPVATISSTRRVESTDDAETDWLSGRGIIRELAALQNPQHNQWEEARQRWAAINNFVRNVLGDPEASLNIPHDFTTIQVETPQRVLPLASLGSGVEQVIVLAAAATVTSKTLVCLEEPETNLHPLLQKKLVRYLTDETDNQYVIATHSSHLLDDSRASAYHIRLTEDGSVSQLARRPHELVEICHDLGYRPSDLLQANCVVWVEGPSDRIYIRRWLELLDPELAEGIDYTIMFYGGRLLSHLSVSEDALHQFISLRALNRSSAIVIDSDKETSRARLNATKRRIQKEFQSSYPAPGHAWVTKCYTIENYIPEDTLRRSVANVHPNRDLSPIGQWSNPLPSRPGEPSFDKISIASTAADLLTSDSLDVFDLRLQVKTLSEFIRAANGQSIAPDPV